MGRARVLLLIAVAVLIVGMTGSARVAAQNASPAAGMPLGIQILPPDQPAYGKTSGEWAASWRHWWFTAGASSECAPSPENEEVWFLGGVPTNAPDLANVHLPCVLPAGSAVVLGVILSGGSTAAECERGYDALIESLGGLEAITVAIDGQPVPDLDQYRVEPAPVSPIATPAPGAPSASPAVAGPYADEAFACGHLMVVVPSPGQHTLRTTVVRAGEVIADIRNELTVSESATPQGATPMP